MRPTSSALSSSYVDPSSLSLPSPSSEASSAESPAPTGPTGLSGPPRKRVRTEASPEEKREARAHRNRIAAQNSRDRRKQQFSQLEEKVRTLQQENEQLRAELQHERERRDGVEKDRENAELKERVKSLEQGWEAVLKALQTQGLPSSVFSGVAKPTEPSPPSTSTPANDSQQSQQPPTTAFPIFSTTPALPPLTPMSTAAPAIFPAPVYQSTDDEPTRHLARVANAASPAASLQRTSHRHRLRTQTTASRTGSVKCWRRPTTTPMTPVQRRRLLAYLLLAFVRSKKLPPQT
ncbi:hypothetical protein BU17DRAFT_75618 [Hysterangium stoloniferum]|nr:hypothetical protein BU17DRAFT_75618 [Hysterangium stoloniferum]